MRLWIILLALVSFNALAFDCHSDCGNDAKFRYPCPTFKNPHRSCEGKDPAKFAICETAKAADCQLWDKAVEWFAPRVKAIIQGEFNARKFADAQGRGQEAQYMTLCTAAAAAACVAVGTSVGGQFGSVIGGAGGIFVSFQICNQSTKW